MTLLDVQNLKTHFILKKAWLPGRRDVVLKAVDGVTFSIQKGEVLGLVGESGCGKSTVARTLTRLETATSGSVQFRNVDILSMDHGTFRPLRRHIQMIFQDPYASLNPRLTIGQTLAEPLRIHGLASSRENINLKILEILTLVGLDKSAIGRFPHEFSGGQRQRVGIARVMLLSPDLIIADEPVSALDVSIQAQILNLIKELQKSRGMAMLFVSHDLGVVRHICDRVAVMYLGRIVEIGTKEEIFNTPSHPYTKMLLASVPGIGRGKTRKRPEMIGEPGNAIDPPNGCAFHPRCIWATDQCRQSLGPTHKFSKTHSSLCHHAQAIQSKKVA